MTFEFHESTNNTKLNNTISYTNCLKGILKVPLTPCILSLQWKIKSEER